ncbi:unnamed protein product [Sphenostylis stenocarpa]|uniref:CASP-like protein n=1 Tax=Sphenostylis stenocarpa TaxID=92480 RepID=A0AA86VET7_9FABA|nr:unnamed protein product [Sphenostylis stenocarpa]
MTTTKSETPFQEKKGDMMKKHTENTEEEELKPSKKKEQKHYHHHPISKPPSAPTLQESFNNSHSHHSFSEGDLHQMVAASHSHSISDGAIKVLKEEVNNKSVVAVMDVGNVEEEGTRDDDDDGVSKKEGKKWYIVLLILRIVAFVFCKIAFAVLASDRKKKVRRESPNRWYDDYSESSFEEDSEPHWYNFEEFKYCLSVNVLGFVYSGFQIFVLVKYFITKRHMMKPKLRCYLNFAMDQVMAYLLMSASSSAATTAHYWSNSILGADKSVEIAKASVALSFVACVAFASSSVLSAFIFSRFN